MESTNKEKLKTILKREKASKNLDLSKSEEFKKLSQELQSRVDNYADKVVDYD